MAPPRPPTPPDPTPPPRLGPWPSRLHALPSGPGSPSAAGALGGYDSAARGESQWPAPRCPAVLTPPSVGLLQGSTPGGGGGAGSPRGRLDQACVLRLRGLPRGSWWQMTQNAPGFRPAQLWLRPSQVHPGTLRCDGRLQGRLFQKPPGGVSLLWGR